MPGSTCGNVLRNHCVCHSVLLLPSRPSKASSRPLGSSKVEFSAAASVTSDNDRCIIGYSGGAVTGTGVSWSSSLTAMAWPCFDGRMFCPSIQPLTMWPISRPASTTNACRNPSRQNRTSERGNIRRSCIGNSRGAQ